MKKLIRNDLILIFTLLFISVIGLLLIGLTRQSENLVAKIYVQNNLVKSIDLSHNEDSEFIIQGTNGNVKIAIKDNSIGVVESECPHKDCVHTGFIKESNHPIICAYNEVYIIIEGNKDFDLEI